MPLLSTRSALSSAGYGQNLSYTPGEFTSFESYGYAPYSPSSISTSVSNSAVSPDGTIYFATMRLASFPSEWGILTYIRDTLTGKLTYVSTTSLGTYSSTSIGDFAISPDSKNVYVTLSNNYSSTTDPTNIIFQFSINSVTKQLTALSPASISVGAGAGVFGPSFSTDGKFLYIGSNSLNRILIYSRNTTTGLLTYSNVFYTPTNTKPLCPIVSVDNAYLYTSSSGSDAANSVLQYARNSITGDLVALSPEGVAGGGQMRYLNFNPAQAGAHCASAADARVYIYSRNSSTGVITAVGYQGGSLFKVAFSSDGTIMLGIGTAGPGTNAVSQSPFQGTIASGTGAVSPYENPKFVSIQTTALLTPSPTYSDYYSMSYGTVTQWRLNGGYLELIDSSAQKGSLLNYSSSTLSPPGINTFLSLPPDEKSLYANGYWNTDVSTTYTSKGTQFDIDAGSGVLNRSTATSDSLPQGPGASVISSDNSFFYQIDSSVNPVVIRQYSRNTTTGNLTALSTPTINLPTPNTWSSTIQRDTFGFPVLSNDEKNLYVSFTSTGSGSVATIPYIIQFSRDTVTGLLTLISTVNIGSSTSASAAGTVFGPEICIHPNDNFVFCVAKTGTSAQDREIITYSRNIVTGELTSVAALNLSTNLAGAINADAFLCMSPDGSNLYFSSTGRLHIISVDSGTGNLTYVRYRTFANLFGNNRMQMLPNGTGIVTYFYSSPNNYFVLLKRKVDGDIPQVASNAFVFNAPVGTTASQISYTATAITSDSSKLYVGGLYATFGTLTS